MFSWFLLLLAWHLISWKSLEGYFRTCYCDWCQKIIMSSRGGDDVEWMHPFTIQLLFKTGMKVVKILDIILIQNIYIWLASFFHEWNYHHIRHYQKGTKYRDNRTSALFLYINSLFWYIFFCINNNGNYIGHYAITLQKKEVWDQLFCPAKCFKICHIYRKRKPM